MAPGHFITFFYGVVDTATGECRYCNAGHPPPLLARRDGTVTRLSTGGIVLGIDAGAVYEEGVTVLSPGDRLLLYSDGLTEAENAQGQPFEEAGLEAIVRTYASQSPESIAAAAFRHVEQHTKDSRITDDLTILLLGRTARSPA